MKAIEFQIGGRKTGKTTLLLEWLKKAPKGTSRLYIGATVQMCDLAFKKSEEMGLDIPRESFISYSDISNGKKLHGYKNIELGVDNIDLLLYSFFGDCPIGRVTATGKDILRDSSD